MIAHQKLIRDKINESPPKDLCLSVKNSQTKRISKQVATEVILRYEWLGTMANTSDHYGIFFDGHIAGAVCFGNQVAGNAYMHRFFGILKSEVMVLARGACVSWAPKNTNSRLIGKSLRLLASDNPQVRAIVAYADPSAGEIGTVYQATNWVYLGNSRSRTCVITPNKKMLHSRRFSQIGGVAAMKEYVDRHPGSKIWYESEQPKKGRYAFLLRDNDDSIQNKIASLVQPYPKRNST